jgi:hypothetical protein
MTTNLRDGLEALYYFGEEDFDPQRNLIRDHSGYQRHLNVNSGVSINQPGPRDFQEAVIPSDGYLSTDYSGFGLEDEFTVFMLFKQQNDINQDRPTYLRIGNHFRFNCNNRDLDFVITDENKNGRRFHVLVLDERPDEYLSIICSYDRSTVKRRVNNEYTRVTETSIPLRTQERGIEFSGNNVGNVSVSSFGYWSRALSEREKLRLNALTAPRRSQL